MKTAGRSLPIARKSRRRKMKKTKKPVKKKSKKKVKSVVDMQEIEAIRDKVKKMMPAGVSVFIALRKGTANVSAVRAFNQGELMEAVARTFFFGRREGV